MVILKAITRILEAEPSVRLIIASSTQEKYSAIRVTRKIHCVSLFESSIPEGLSDRLFHRAPRAVWPP